MPLTATPLLFLLLLLLPLFTIISSFSPTREVGDCTTFESRPKFAAPNRVIQNNAAGVLSAGPRHTVSKSTVFRCKTLSERGSRTCGDLFSRGSTTNGAVSKRRDLGALSGESEILENVIVCCLMFFSSHDRKTKEKGDENI